MLKRSISEISILGLLILITLFIPYDFSFPMSELDQTIIMDIRMPRAVMAILTGIILACCGLVFQSIFNNPLADSFSLGISSGASFGSALGIIAGLHFMFIPFVSMGCSVLTLLTVIILAHIVFRTQQKIGLILFGMFVNFFFASALYGLTMLAPNKSRAILNYLFGSISTSEWRDIWMVTPFAVIGLGVLLLLSRTISILSLGDDVAVGLGLDRTKWMYIILMIASVVTASLISLTGIIGFVGLIVPQLVLHQSWSFRWKLIHSGLMGAIAVLFSDFVGSRLLDPIQIPVSVVLSIFGLPILVLLMIQMNRRVH